MDRLSLSITDLSQHVVTFGMDIYPPVEIPNERTHLNTFYEEATARWPNLFERLVASDTEFRVSKGFRASPDRTMLPSNKDTFVLTNRGPVFIFPLLLHGPVGDTGLEKEYLELFQQSRRLFFSALPERKILRVGLVRDLWLTTGQAPCQGILSGGSSFAGADLMGGSTVLQYRDSKYNHRITLQPVEVRKATQLPVGTRVEQRESYALHVQLDVNNLEPRPLEDADIEEVLDRATSLWPDTLIEYLNERTAP